MRLPLRAPAYEKLRWHRNEPITKRFLQQVLPKARMIQRKRTTGLIAMTCALRVVTDKIIQLALSTPTSPPQPPPAVLQERRRGAVDTHVK